VDGLASTCLSADPGPGPFFGGEHRPFEWGKRAVGLCSPCLDGEGGCAGGGLPLGAEPVLSSCGEVSLVDIQSSIISVSMLRPVHKHTTRTPPHNTRHDTSNTELGGAQMLHVKVPCALK